MQYQSCIDQFIEFLAFVGSTAWSILDNVCTKKEAAWWALDMYGCQASSHFVWLLTHYFLPLLHRSFDPLLHWSLLHPSTLPKLLCSKDPTISINQSSVFQLFHCSFAPLLPCSITPSTNANTSLVYCCFTSLLHWFFTPLIHCFHWSIGPLFLCSISPMVQLKLSYPLSLLVYYSFAPWLYCTYFVTWLHCSIPPIILCSLTPLLYLYCFIAPLLPCSFPLLLHQQFLHSFIAPWQSRSIAGTRKLHYSIWSHCCATQVRFRYSTNWRLISWTLLFTSKYLSIFG